MLIHYVPRSQVKHMNQLRWEARAAAASPLLEHPSAGDQGQCRRRPHRALPDVAGFGCDGARTQTGGLRLGHEHEAPR